MTVGKQFLPENPGISDQFVLLAFLKIKWGNWGKEVNWLA